MKNIKEILKHYLMAALWTEELDNRDIDEISPLTMITAEKDISDFVNKAGDLLNGIEDSQIGHDFWLTRNGHGAGFWDRGLGEVGEKLTAICKNYKEKNVFTDGAGHPIEIE